jgi:hypothetical protein
MSGTAAYSYEITRGLNKKQTIRVTLDDGQELEFVVGPNVSKTRINALLPMLVADSLSKKRRKAAK